MHDAPEVAKARDGRGAGDRAQRLLRVLVDQRTLVLRPGTRVRDLARKLARVWASHGPDDDEPGSQLSAWLAEQEEVEEICAGELERGALARGD